MNPTVNSRTTVTLTLEMTPNEARNVLKAMDAITVAERLQDEAAPKGAMHVSLWTYPARELYGVLQTVADIPDDRTRHAVQLPEGDDS